MTHKKHTGKNCEIHQKEPRNTGSLPEGRSLSADSQQFWQTKLGTWQLVVPASIEADGKSTAGKGLAVVRNLPIKVTSQRASTSGILRQGARISTEPMNGRDLKPVFSKVGRLHLEKTRLSASSR
jgi:hypothetical protein